MDVQIKKINILHGDLVARPSKSFAHRYLIAAALSDDESIISIMFSLISLPSINILESLKSMKFIFQMSAQKTLIQLLTAKNLVQLLESLCLSHLGSMTKQHLLEVTDS